MGEEQSKAELADFALGWARRKNVEALALMGKAVVSFPEMKKANHVATLAATIIKHIKLENVAVMYAELVYEVAQERREHVS